MREMVLGLEVGLSTPQRASDFASTTRAVALLAKYSPRDSNPDWTGSEPDASSVGLEEHVGPFRIVDARRGPDGLDFA
jgi:hypothetical protein